MWLLGKVTIFLTLSQTLANNKTFEAFVSDTLAEYCPTQLSCPKDEGYLPYGFASTSGPCCQTCSCADNCESLGACCLDRSGNNSQTTAQAANVGCHPGEFSDFATVDFQFLVINKCPKEYRDTQVSQQCHTLFQETLEQAQFVSDSRGMTYKNAFCAKCNDVSDFVGWKIYIDCHKQLSANHITEISFRSLLDKQCRIWFKVPEIRSIHTIRCYDTNIDTCQMPDQGHTYYAYINKACETLQTGRVLVVGAFFKNIFCYLCHPSADLGEPYRVCPDTNDLSRSPMFSFSALLTGDLAQSKGNGPELESCAALEIYDNLKVECVQLKCPHLSVPNYGKCVTVLENVVGYEVQVAVNFKPSTPQRGTNETISEQFIMKVTDQIRAHVDKVNTYKCDICGYVSSVEKAAKELTIYTYVFVRTTIPCQLSKIAQLAESLNGLNIHVSMGNSRIHFKAEFETKALEGYHSNQGKYLYHSYPILRCRDGSLLYKKTCPSVELTGVEFIDALERQCIDKTKYHVTYSTMKNYSRAELANVTLDICVNEYLGTNYDNGIGHSSCQYMVVITACLAVNQVFRLSL